MQISPAPLSQCIRCGSRERISDKISNDRMRKANEALVSNDDPSTKNNIWKFRSCLFFTFSFFILWAFGYSACVQSGESIFTRCTLAREEQPSLPSSLRTFRFEKVRTPSLTFYQDTFLARLFRTQIKRDPKCNLNTA